MSGSSDHSTNDRFNQLQQEGKDLAEDGRISDSIRLFKEAYKINPTDKVRRRIEKLQIEIVSVGTVMCHMVQDGRSNDAFLEEYGEELEENMVELGDKFYLCNELSKKLYPYQQEGVKWLWHLYRKKKGGILGDDMGLGKTIQIIAFLSGMFDMDLIKCVLIVMPVSLLPNWEKEFRKWTPGLPINSFHTSNKRERERILLKTQNHGGILITSYGMIVTNSESLSSKNNREFVWDYVILDEGHKIKNPTKTTKAVHGIPARNRIILTGTPIQNNLGELWSLFDFVQQGTLLGSRQTFKMQYETPITRSREKDATAGERELGKEIAKNLRYLIQPYFLRRTKLEVCRLKDNDGNNLSFQTEDQLKNAFCLSRKNDFIVWLFLSEKQIQIYKDFLELDIVKNILMTKRSPLVQLTVLKKICDHPRLLSKKACIQLGLDSDTDFTDELLEDEAYSAVSIDGISEHTLIEESGKLQFLLYLLENLKSDNHRTLVFSQSRKMLDIIQRILVDRNWKVMRLDGTIISTEERQQRIQKFQNDPSIPVFLLTTQVGGVGLTLTGADRVIIYDPSWNPATDAQAVDRVYRIGQNKSVIIYRLITCSTVEEKIYRRQIFKDSITRQTTGGNKDPHRYFTRQELRELFSLENPRYSSTQAQLEMLHTSQRSTDVELDGHIAFLHSLQIFGLSDHDLMFNDKISENPEENDDKEHVPEEYIKKRVETAQQLVQLESAQVLDDLAKCNTFTRPFSLPTNNTKRPIVKGNYKPPEFPDVIDLDVVNMTLTEMSIKDKSVEIIDSSTRTAKESDDFSPVITKSEEILNYPSLSILPENKNFVKSCMNEENMDSKNVKAINLSEIAKPKQSLKTLVVGPDENIEDAKPLDSDLSDDLFVADSEDEEEKGAPLKTLQIKCNNSKHNDNSMQSSDIQSMVIEINESVLLDDIRQNSEIIDFGNKENLMLTNSPFKSEYNKAEDKENIETRDTNTEGQKIKLLSPLKQQLETPQHKKSSSCSLSSLTSSGKDMNEGERGINQPFFNDMSPVYRTCKQQKLPFRRITPWKVPANMSIENVPFQKAVKASLTYPMASSPITVVQPNKLYEPVTKSLTPCSTMLELVENISMLDTSSKQDISLSCSNMESANEMEGDSVNVSSNSTRKILSDDDYDNSSIHFQKRSTKHIIISDDSESEMSDLEDND